VGAVFNFSGAFNSDGFFHTPISDLEIFPDLPTLVPMLHSLFGMAVDFSERVFVVCNDVFDGFERFIHSSISG
jgi:hypothetical protein